MRVLRSHRLPFRVRADRCVQALSLLPGHRPGPAGGMPGRGEDAHVDAELGDEDLRGPLVGPGDGIEPGQCVPEGGDHRVEPGAHRGDSAAHFKDSAQDNLGVGDPHFMGFQAG